jgi:glucose/arabinose dehydrogenase
MLLMGRTMALVAALACGACATMDEGQPVSTTPPTTEAPTEPTQVSSSRRGEIPVGQQLDVRLQEPLSSKTATVEQRFEATTAVDLRQGDRVLVPAGSLVRGVVREVDDADRIDRAGRLTLGFDQMVVNGREYPMRGMATQVFESKGIREEVATVGTAGGVGAIVGGIIGGLRGALIGAIVGSGGVIAATEGKDVELPAGTIVRVRLDSPVQIR